MPNGTPSAAAQGDMKPAPVGAWARGAPPLPALAAGLVEFGVDTATRAVALFVPGRLELFGKHTDYAGGRSLVGAVDRGLTLLMAPRTDATLRWRDVGRGVEVVVDLESPGQGPGDWSNYLRTVAGRTAADYGAWPRGADVAMTSDLPAAAGLSSSSALVVAAWRVLSAAAGEDLHPRLAWLEADRERLAGYLGAVESGAPFEHSGGSHGVGTRGGCGDHLAILASRRGCLLQYRFGPLACERRIAVDRSWRWCIATSGVRAEKTGAAGASFNRIADRAALGAAAWRRGTGGGEPHLGAALATAGSVERLVAAADAGLERREREDIRRRVHQFAVESGELVPAAAEALAQANGAALGALAARSQELAESCLGNQVAETSALVHLAREAGAEAASAFGAGFGGAVWALATPESPTEFIQRWQAAYTAAFPIIARDATFWRTALADGARWLLPPDSGVRK